MEWGGVSSVGLGLGGVVERLSFQFSCFCGRGKSMEMGIWANLGFQVGKWKLTG